MKKRLLLGGIIAFATTIVWARGERGSWDDVKQLHSGQRIEVLAVRSKASEGTFQSATDDSLVCRVKTQEQTVARRDVLRVAVRDASRSAGRGLLGASILGGAATAVTLILAAPCNGEGHYGSCIAKGLPAIGGAAALGYWAGGSSRYHIIYQVKKHRDAPNR
jgi:hypothetical protein